jgi:hypothetical protein
MSLLHRIAAMFVTLWHNARTSPAFLSQHAWKWGTLDETVQNELREYREGTIFRPELRLQPSLTYVLELVRGLALAELCTDSASS